jgi:hypothetical protein
MHILHCNLLHFTKAFYNLTAASEIIALFWESFAVILFCTVLVYILHINTGIAFVRFSRMVLYCNKHVLAL